MAVDLEELGRIVERGSPRDKVKVSRAWLREVHLQLTRLHKYDQDAYAARNDGLVAKSLFESFLSGFKK